MKDSEHRAYFSIGVFLSFCYSIFRRVAPGIRFGFRPQVASPRCTSTAAGIQHPLDGMTMESDGNSISAARLASVPKRPIHLSLPGRSGRSPELSRTFIRLSRTAGSASVPAGDRAALVGSAETAYTSADVALFNTRDYFPIAPRTRLGSWVPCASKRRRWPIHCAHEQLVSSLGCLPARKSPRSNLCSCASASPHAIRTTQGSSPSSPAISCSSGPARIRRGNAHSCWWARCETRARFAERSSGLTAADGKTHGTATLRPKWRGSGADSSRSRNSKSAPRDIGRRAQVVIISRARNAYRGTRNQRIIEFVPGLPVPQCDAGRVGAWVGQSPRFPVHPVPKYLAVLSVFTTFTIRCLGFFAIFQVKFGGQMPRAVNARGSSGLHAIRYRNSNSVTLHIRPPPRIELYSIQPFYFPRRIGCD